MVIFQTNMDDEQHTQIIQINLKKKQINSQK